ENAFVNDLVERTDTVYRDPWAIPKTTETGEIVRGQFNTPMETDALERILDPETGLVREVHPTRTYEDGLLHAIASRRQTLAFMANLVTGSFGTNNSFQRQDMVAATESIDLNQLSQEDAETLILS